ncbi:MAG: alpha-glucan family phosphorylase [Chloroflexota bacterium]|nr:alpha-glucan family phosphorylase [Chloroflexota bacterium]
METETPSLPDKIPQRIARLEELAYNFWWSWHRQSRDLFKLLDHSLWRSTGHNPVKMLLEVSPERLKELAADPLFLRQYDATLMTFDHDIDNGHLWFPTEHPDLMTRPVAYFSAEFGLHQSLPIYSGGLGVLAGDHCKEASDIGLPFVAVGFLYEMGYFRQHITADGWQEAIYPRFNPKEVAIREASPPQPLPGGGGEGGVFVPVEVGDRTVHLQVWHVQAGRTSLYLMDADHDLNIPWDRELTARLYGGDREMRIQQEIVLGIGGLRVLRALGIDPIVFHLNEGHSAFLVLERARELVEAGRTFDEARQAVEETTIFTTHTPVPAGHDVFPFHMIEKYFHTYWPRLGLSREQFLDLGNHAAEHQGFNMTALALGMSGQRNGVSKLHGEVSRRMWQSVWPDKPAEQVPISHVTNGIHVPAWVGEAMNRIYRKYLGPDWIERHDDLVPWERILDVPDDELWAAHLHLKRKLTSLIRERARQRRVERRLDAELVLCAGTFLDPDALIIGFARRFATYKRATIIFHDLDRLRRLLHDRYRPVQFIFTGKAHPADEGGKRLIQHVYNAAKDPAMGGRIAFIEDYDMQVARYMVQGVDVWLNTPRPPREASGTSGQKAAANGVPNLSMLDGWWAEGYNGANGWAIDSGQSHDDPWAQDAADADALYHLLENEVVPLFYKRDADNVPWGWVQVMKEAIRTSVPVFCTRRMVKEYTERFYIPAARRAMDR